MRNNEATLFFGGFVAIACVHSITTVHGADPELIIAYGVFYLLLLGVWLFGR